MNSKDTKKYTLIKTIFNSQPNDDALFALFSELAGIDFTTAFEVWEFILNGHQAELGDRAIAGNLESKLFTLFNTISETKTRQLFTESAPLNKSVYTFSATSCNGTNLQILVNLILSAKIEPAEQALSCIKSNALADFDYGEAMRRIIDTVFATYCAEKGVKKCELNRKQKTLLLDYIAKIKGPNKALLTQRIKEL